MKTRWPHLVLHPLAVGSEKGLDLGRQRAGKGARVGRVVEDGRGRRSALDKAWIEAGEMVWRRYLWRDEWRDEQRNKMRGEMGGKIVER